MIGLIHGRKEGKDRCMEGKEVNVIREESYIYKKYKLAGSIWWKGRKKEKWKRKEKELRRKEKWNGGRKE